jgi:hypothetical protein
LCGIDTLMGVAGFTVGAILRDNTHGLAPHTDPGQESVFLVVTRCI